MKKKRIRIVILVIAIMIVLWTIWGNLTVGVTRYMVKNNRIPGSFDHFKIAEQVVKRLVDIAPCYYVTGNHEAWIEEQYKELEKILLSDSSQSRSVSRI